MLLAGKQITGFDSLNTVTSQSREELYYTDNFGDTIQLTYSGSIGGQNLSPASGSEIKTGCTFNGYPVYRSFFSGSAISQNFVLKSGIRDVIRTGGWACHDGTAFSRYRIPCSYSTTVFFYVTILTNNNLVAYRGTYFDQKDYRFFVEYTKL
ncbi:MAG: hypothetical protein FK734_10670 [Asgard group archaeon]|nr:hypothetical protein [Asgard group archaeon]